jgi:hypothetical protein
MSRIIMSRHPNGEERLVCGWDRPLQTAFIDLYDDEGECMVTRGCMSGERLTPFDVRSAFDAWARQGYGLGCTTPTVDKAVVLLREHRTLDYPASNVVLDLST